MSSLSCPKCGARQDLRSVRVAIALYGEPQCASCSIPLPAKLLADTAKADAVANDLACRQAKALI